MSESYDPKRDSDVPEELDHGVVEEDGEGESEAPRRAASAEFVVSSEVGAATALRDAMDPANQSLADALRLSFRVLQIVILILIVLFLGSGIVTVPDKNSGVLTRWGKIVPYRGEEALDSGLKYSLWPYPVSEFIVFEVENRTVDVSETFLPNSKVRGYTIQQHIERASAADRYRTGVDGQLLTADGDIAHVAATVTYEIEDPVRFVENVPLQQADSIVRWATERAVVNAVATMTLQNLMEITEDVRQRIQESAQRALDDVDAGIRIRQVALPEPPRPPYAILNTFTDLQESRVQAENMIQQARRSAEEARQRIAGRNWRTIIDQINQYEIAESLGDEPAAEQLLAEINTWLDDESEGQSSKIISDARSYQSIIDSTLGNEAKRFASLLPTYREHPDLVVRQRWMSATASVLSRIDAEVFSVPTAMGAVRIGISGLEEIAQRRRDMKLDRQNEAGWRQGIDLENPYMLQAEQMTVEGPGRRLQRQGDSVQGMNTQDNNQN